MAEQKNAYYKETLNALEKLNALCRKREINPDLFEGYRIDSGPDPYAPKPISDKNIGLVVIKEPSQPTNMPPEKWPVDVKAIDSSVVKLVKKHYGFKG